VLAECPRLAETLLENPETLRVRKVAKVFCPIDKNLLLKSGDGRPLYQCGDCSGILITLPTPDEQTESADSTCFSTLRCPNDGSAMYGRETRGVIVHLCRKCTCAWVDGDAQEELMSRLPSWFGKPSAQATTETVAGGIVAETIITILLS
jgi:hypothetical protein